MSNQVYSNFETRKLYRTSYFKDGASIGPNQIIPESLTDQDVGPFTTIPINANYNYVPVTRRLEFLADGVYAISLNTVWSTTNDNGGIVHWMDLDGAFLDKLGYVSAKPLTNPSVPSSLYSTIVLKVSRGQFIRFKCLGNNSGTQTLLGSASDPRTEFTISKLS